MEWGLDVGMELLVSRVTPHGGMHLLQFHVGLLILPMIGGLISGIAVRWLCPQSTGQGTDLLTRAFHREHGELPLRGPAVKAAAAVVVISCGGSAGPEGPIAGLGAALGATTARLFHVPPRQRRILLLAGCAAGVGAIFRCPLGGALFAASIPYCDSDYEAEAIVPSLVASVVGYCVFMGVWGHGEPLLHQAYSLRFGSLLELVPFTVLGLVCGLTAMLFGICFRGVERIADRARPAWRWLTPGIGGVATGVVACLLPQVMDGRYRFIQEVMDGTLLAGGSQGWLSWACLLAMVVFAKCLATSLTVGSGAAGGVLGPSLFIGGAAGAMVGAGFQALLPGVFPEPLRQALIPVGMGGVLAATMRTPLAAIVMVAEMTASYGLIVPLMLVCATSYVLGRRWGLNRFQVPTAAQSPAHSADAVVHLLENSRVGDFLDNDPRWSLPPDAGLDQIVARIEPGQQPSFAVIQDGRLLGAISLPDLGRVIANPFLSRIVVAHDMMTPDPPCLNPDNDLYYAVEVFRRTGLDVLPVVARHSPQAWLGMLTRRRVFEVIRQQVEISKRYIVEEHAGLLAIEQEARLESLLMLAASSPAAGLQQLMVPIEVAGRSLRQSQFGTRYAVQVLAIREPDGTLQCPPDLDRPLHADLRLLAVVGRHDARSQPAVPRTSGAARDATKAS
jgi:CIC family chloride channel protein